MLRYVNVEKPLSTDCYQWSSEVCRPETPPFNQGDRSPSDKNTCRRFNERNERTDKRVFYIVKNKQGKSIRCSEPQNDGHRCFHGIPSSERSAHVCLHPLKRGTFNAILAQSTGIDRNIYKFSNSRLERSDKDQMLEILVEKTLNYILGLRSDLVPYTATPPFVFMRDLSH